MVFGGFRYFFDLRFTGFGFRLVLWGLYCLVCFLSLRFCVGWYNITSGVW